MLSGTFSPAYELNMETYKLLLLHSQNYVVWEIAV